MPHVLHPGQTLQVFTSSSHLISPNGCYAFGLRTDGDLTLNYVPPDPSLPVEVRWSSGTGIFPGAVCSMFRDGTLALHYLSARRFVPFLWTSQTAGHSNSCLVMHDDGDLIIYQRLRPLWKTHTPRDLRTVPEPGPAKGDQLHPKDKLLPGEQLVSQNRQFRMQLQLDGNLVLFDGNDDIWESETQDRAVTHCTMQTDGNLVIYDGDSVVWASGTGHRTEACLEIRDDGNAVIYASVPIWSRHAWAPRAAAVGGRREPRREQDLRPGMNARAKNGAG
jgi:hypothetical protein